MFDLIVKPEVYKTLDEAYYWYEHQLPGLGERLLDEIDTYFDKLKRTPFFYSYLEENYRQLILKNLPFKIIFEIIDDNVIIYAIFHTSQNTKKNI